MATKLHVTPTLSLADLRKGTVNTSFEVPEFPVDGKPGVLWLRPLPASKVLSYLESLENSKDSERAALSRDSMIEFVKQAVVSGEHDQTLMFGELSTDEVRDLLPISVFNRLLEAITNMAGLGRGADSGDAGVGKGSSDPLTVSSPTA